MSFRRVFRNLGKRKKDGGENRESPPTPTPASPLPEAPILSTSPRPVPSPTVSVSILHSSSQIQESAHEDHRETEVPSASRNAWTNLAAFLDILNHTPMYSLLAAAIDNLSWFIRAHENVIATQDEYETLRTQIEALFKDLCVHFSGDTSPTMTASILNLCGAIETELTRVYDTQDRNKISRYMQADTDLDKVTECYRRIRGHLERLMLNANLNVWKIMDKHATASAFCLNQTHDQTAHYVTAQDAQLDRISPSMSACYDSAEANMVQRRECAPNTREQVLRDLEAWKNNPDGEKICWINGMAGTGKTTIATSLCSTLHTSHELGASFFCTRSIPACRDVKLILPTIAYQLARFSIPFRGALLQVLDRDPDVHTKVPQVQFRRMILEPLRAIVRSLPSIVVVIDALDECDDDNGVEQVLEVLLENVSALPIKFLISCRPEHRIRERISKSTAKKQLILHELDKRMVKADIETYLQTELASVSTIISKSQLATLVERAGALFIYAATVVRYIKRGYTAERLATVLQVPSRGQESTNQTREIDQLYDTVLITAFDNQDLERTEKDRMQFLLHTVICAQEPLTVDALAGLLGLIPNQVTHALKPLWSVLHLSDSDPAHRVSTLHTSFSDYMFDSDRSKRFACNAGTHNGKLVDLSFMRIGRNIPQFNICRLESSYVFDEDVPNLGQRAKQCIPLDLLYACQYWAVHLSQGGVSVERAAALYEFLSKRLLLWMEVLNLSKRIKQGAGQIEMALSWLKTTDRPENTMPIARDVLRFVTMFATSPVSQSTPHLYVSLLSAWPHYQPVAKSYTRQHINPVKIQGIEAAERQLSLLSLIPARSGTFSVSYSPTCAFFAAGTHSGKVLVWDTASCQLTIDPIMGHADTVRAIVISPDGTQICSASHDETLRIWDSQSGQLIAGPLKGHTSWIFSVAYSSDGRWLASASHDGTVRTWDTQNWGAKHKLLNGRDGRVFSVTFSPDSSIIAAGSELLIHFWDPVSGQMTGGPLTGHTNLIWELAFTPDGRHLITGSEDRSIRVWDVSTGDLTFGPLLGHTSAVECITVSPNGDFLASAALDNTIRIWDTRSWTIRSVFRDTGIAKSVGFSPDGSRLLSGSVDGNIRIWEVPDISEKIKTESRSNGHSGTITSVAFSPCGAYIVSGSEDMTVRIWDAQSGQPIRDPLKGHDEWVIRIGILADGDRIFSVSRDRIIHVWNRRNSQLEYTIGPVEIDGNHNIDYQEDWPAVLIFNGRRVVCGSQSGHIYMWESSKIVHKLTGHRAAVHSIALSPDERSFVSGDHSGTLIIWDANSGEKILGPFKAHSDRIRSATFSPDGLLVASGSSDSTIRLWSPHTTSPHLVSGSLDMTVRLWDIITGRSIAVFEGHTDWVYSVAFSPDGTHIASGSADMTIRVWEPTVSTEAPAGDSDNDETNQRAKKMQVDEPLSWKMDEHGWVNDHDDRPLLWVPPDLRSVLLRSQNTGLISRQDCIELDFSDARIGDIWATCYEPFPPAIEN